jgi:hypothetical protein
MDFLDSGHIQFIDIVRKNAYKEIYITGSECGGIAASNTNLFVCGKGSVHVLDHQGRPVRKIKTKAEHRTPLYVYVAMVICCYTPCTT